MSHSLLMSLAAVVVLGIGAQWLAWKLRLPAIILLLAIGFLAGPISGLVFSQPILDPDALMGDLLLPFVALSVALILYEGGLSLRFAELRGVGSVLWRLVTIGAIVTWILTAIAAWWFLEMSTSLAVLLGAILVVTGPTVILPLLREIRPKGRVGAIIKWEGIVIDPIGAMLAVLVFEAILLGGVEQAAAAIGWILAKTIVIGGGLGLLAGLLLAFLIRSFLIPDFLHNAVSLMLVLAVYAGADSLQSESGLFAATTMGITLANQRIADIRHIVEFKENLQVLLISSLFILLAARVRLDTLADLGVGSAILLAVLIVVVRPIAVVLSTISTTLTRNEIAFLSLMAPRGIVAASVSAVFALRMHELGFDDARQLVPITFMMIVGTVLFSSVVTPRVARRLGVSDPSPQGVLIVGAHLWARALAETLKAHGFRVVLVDTNRDNIVAARLEGLETYSGSILAESALDELDLDGIGRLIAATPNESVNVLAVQRFSRVFGRSEVYQAAPAKDAAEDDDAHKRLHGRLLFRRDMTYSVLLDRIRRGAKIKATPITEEFSFDQFRERHGEKAIPMFILTESKDVRKLSILADDSKPAPKPGQILISLVDAESA